MNISVESVEVKQDEESGTVAQVVFRVEGHPKPYEITLYSEKGDDWEYGLHFAGEPGSEKLIGEVEAYLEENDDAFRMLVDAVLSSGRGR